MYFEPFSSKEMETQKEVPVRRNKKLLQGQRERCHDAYGEGPHMNMSSQISQSQMFCGLDSSRQREIIIGNRHGDWTNWMRSTCEAGANQAKTWEQNCETGRVGKNQETQKNKKNNGLSTHKPKNQKTKKPKNQETKKPKNQKTKKTKNQKTKKTKKTKIAHPKGRGVRWRVLGLVFLFFCFFWFFGFLFFCFFFCFLVFLVCVWIAIADVPSRDCQALSVVALEVGQAKTKKPKNQKKPKKPRLHTPRGGGSDGECWVLSFCFFVFFVFFGFLFFVFLFFCFFGFLVCVWIAIADVPSRDCQALSVVALEARSIHYSTAMFAMT